MAAEPLSLMEFVHALLADASLHGLFADDPRATLEAHGLGDLSPADVHDALDLVQDNEITDFHGTPSSWDVDPEAFGHGDTADHLTWADAGEPAGGTWASWTPFDAGVAPSSDAGWADDGYGSGHELDLGPADDGPDGAGPDLHHHHG